ncbi:hypothetical protein BRC91_10480 [Halobacteriales archaeon QS_4_62_28]|nr:MAG: hypothetical protein BRC91_10480 [Halobacteriales archaeon QS_4_62_28]
MTSQSFTDRRIGPELDLEGFRLPPHVGARLATLFGRDTPITTGSEWVQAMRTVFTEEFDRFPSEDALCRAEDGAHSVTIDGDRDTFVCVLDPLIVPFLRDEPGRIESTTPEDGATVTIDIDDGGTTATPESAVISLGLTHHVEADSATPETVYRQVCGYIHVFAAPAEYERWADNVEAATTSVPVETGIGLARELAAVLFDA